MIGSIKGKIILKKEKFVIIEVTGVGYKINISPDTQNRIKGSGDLVSFWIHMHIKEDAQDLYGFLEYGELEFFEMLISISGIGPKGALTILGIAPIEILKKAISTGDISYLTKISGIGKKTAEKMILELRDKIGEEKTDETLQQDIDTLEALKSLGYSQSEAREALKKVGKEINTSKKISAALKILGEK